MVKVIGLVSALLFFGLWMSIVGNPHVVETVLGLMMALALGIWVWRVDVKFATRRE